MINYTKEQAKLIADRYNELANHEIQVQDVHYLLLDDVNDGIRDASEAIIEIPAIHSKTGNPVTFTIAHDETELQE